MKGRFILINYIKSIEIIEFIFMFVPTKQSDSVVSTKSQYSPIIIARTCGGIGRMCCCS